MANPGATNSYGPGGGLSTTIQSRGMDIGPIPDFWGDLQQIKDRLRPVSRGIGGGQAQALRQPAPSYSEAPQRMESAPSGIDAQLDYAQKRAAIIAALNPGGPKPSDYATPSMSPQGELGSYVNPNNVPLAYQGKMRTGFSPDSATGNYSYDPTARGY